MKALSVIAVVAAAAAGIAIGNSGYLGRVVGGGEAGRPAEIATDASYALQTTPPETPKGDRAPRQDGDTNPNDATGKADMTAAADTPAPAAKATAPMPAPAPSPAPASASSGPASNRPKVDETALRYFATKGDTRRLETEIARLKALYPTWTPPADPLAVPNVGDPKLDQMWKLYSDGKYAELRKAIADRQTAEPNWQVPDDLLQRLAVAEAREQLVNASDLKQYEAVIRIGAANTSLLTCGDVDVLWRVAEAFAKTNHQDRAGDAYTYVLKNCDKPQERLATIQKALPLLPRTDIDKLLTLERKAPDGTGEFEPVRIDIARQSLADADGDPKLTVAPDDIARVEKAAGDKGLVSDDLLLGWYYVRRDNPQVAEDWFRKAYEKDKTAGPAQGLALALVNENQPQEAEDILYKWRETNDDTRKVYLAAVANLLAITPPPPLTAELLDRMSRAVYAGKDAASAQQFGWYADGLNQFVTAARWFKLALGWKPDDEPSAYGLALMRWKLGDMAGVREIQAAWVGRSERIPTVGQPSIETSALGKNRDTQRTTQPAPQAVQQPREVPAATYQDEVQQPVQEQPTPRPVYRSQTVARGCSTTEDPSSMRPNEALTRGWCLMRANRPIEAAAAFEAAMRGGGQTASDAAYGQSLAYLRAGLADKAAVASSKAPMSYERGIEVRTGLLEAQATSAFEHERYNETLAALDERARIAPERTNLLVLRGYAYMKLRRFDEAEQVLRAAAATGDHDALKGLGDLDSARQAKN